MTEQESLDRAVIDCAPPDWDMSPYKAAIKLRDLMAKEPGIYITGSGMDCDGRADFSFTLNGENYWVYVERAKIETQ